MHMSKSEYLKKHTEWGKEGISREEWLKKEGLTDYTYRKLKIAQRVMAEQERALNKAAAAKVATDKAAATAAASASRERAKGTKRTQADDDDDDDDSSDSSDSSDGRDGAPSPDSDADYAP